MMIFPAGADKKKHDETDSTDSVVQYLAGDMHCQQHQQGQRQGIPQQTQSRCTTCFISPKTHQRRYRQTGTHFRCHQRCNNIGYNRINVLHPGTRDNSIKKKCETTVFEKADHHGNSKRLSQGPTMSRPV